MELNRIKTELNTIKLGAIPNGEKQIMYYD